MRPTASLAAGWILALAVTDLSSAAEFYALGDLPGGGVLSVTGGVSTYGHSYTNSGVVGYSLSDDGPEAFFWTPKEGMVGLGDLPGGDTESYATQFYSWDGPISGFSASASGTEAFIADRKYRSDPWKITGLGDLPGGDFFSQGSAIDRRVLDPTYIVGRSSSVDGMEAFLWTGNRRTGDGEMQGLGDLPGGEFHSEATAVGFRNSEPVVFGHSSSALGTEAFRWSPEMGMQGLGTLPGADGSVVTGAYRANVAVGYATTPTGTEAFIWESENSRNPGMRSLGTFGPGISTRALGVHGSYGASTVVGTASTQEGDRAFIWAENLGLRDFQTYLTEGFDLDLSGWTLTAAQGIGGGLIAGTGINPQGETEAWAASINMADFFPRPEITAQMTTLPDGNVAWEVGLQYHDNRQSSAAIDLKFEGAFVQLDGHVDDPSMATILENLFGFNQDVDDVVMATLLEGMTGFDKQADSWFYLDTSGELGAWTMSLPSQFGGNNPADPPRLNNFGEELGLGGIDGLMPGETSAYISAGTGPLSSFISGPIAHFVLPADDYLTVTGMVARDGLTYEYAVKVGDFQWVRIPPGQSVARPEATRAAQEVTNALKYSG